MFAPEMETPEERAQREQREREKSALMEKRLKDERCLIFQNLLHGVPVGQVAQAFHRSDADVMSVFHFVLRKIRSWCIERMERPILGATVEEIQRTAKRRCLAILPLLNLDKEPRYAKVIHEHLELKADGTMRNEDFLRTIKPQ